MKQLLWSMLAIVVTITFSLAQGENPDQALFEFITPKIQNMGTVLDGDILKGSIVFKYKGSGEFHIQAVNTSCGCTVVEFQKNTYKPGEVISIPFEINTTGFRGPIQKRIAIYYDKPRSSILVFKVRAVVTPLLEYKPSFVRLRLSPDKPAAVGEVIFKNNSAQPVKITALEIPDKRINATFSSKVIAPHKSEKLTVVFEGVVEDNQRFVIKFQNTAYPEKWFSIPVYVFPARGSE